MDGAFVADEAVFVVLAVAPCGAGAFEAATGGIVEVGSDHFGDFGGEVDVVAAFVASVAVFDGHVAFGVEFGDVEGEALYVG